WNLRAARRTAAKGLIPRGAEQRRRCPARFCHPGAFVPLMLRLIRCNEIPVIWGRLAAALAPALVRERRSSWPVLDALMSGAWEAWALNGADAIGFVVTSTGYVGDTDIKACWIVFAGGAIAGGPKRRTDIGRLFLAEFERL